MLLIGLALLLASSVMACEIAPSSAPPADTPLYPIQAPFDEIIPTWENWKSYYDDLGYSPPIPHYAALTGSNSYSKFSPESNSAIHFRMLKSEDKDTLVQMAIHAHEDKAQGIEYYRNLKEEYMSVTSDDLHLFYTYSTSTLLLECEPKPDEYLRYHYISVLAFKNGMPIPEETLVFEGAIFRVGNYTGEYQISRGDPPINTNDPEFFYMPIGLSLAFSQAVEDTITELSSI